MTAAAIASIVVVTNLFGRLAVDTHGARAVSYAPAGGEEVFATFSDGTGGMPLCWPWFGDGPEGGRRHGIARYEDFAMARKEESSEVSELELRLDSSCRTKHVFDRDFSLSVVFRIDEEGLSVSMAAHNTGTELFTVTEAFHPYFAVSEASQCRVELNGEVMDVQCDGSHRCRIEKHGASYALVDPAGGRYMDIASTGAPDMLVWNPGPRPAVGAKITSRLAPDDWHRFVCVENGAFGDRSAYVLAPGQEHTLSIRISEHKTKGSIR